MKTPTVNTNASLSTDNKFKDMIVSSEMSTSARGSQAGQIVHTLEHDWTIHGITYHVWVHATTGKQVGDRMFFKKSKVSAANVHVTANLGKRDMETLNSMYDFVAMANAVKSK